ncbi:MAG: GNAT family N-acetyltransferase [Anaerolineaceae bacterium]
MLAQYYRGVAIGEGSVGYVGLVDGKCCGFVCGVWDAGQLQRWLVWNNLFRLIFWGSLQIIVSPSLFLSFLRKLRVKGESIDTQGYELRPIVVAPEARGSGLSTSLISTLVNDALKRNYASIFLDTEEENIPAQKLYEKVGFRKINTWKRENQIYFRYERLIGEHN